MRLSRPVALIVAVLTVAPWAYFVFFLVHFTAAFPKIPSPAVPPEQFFQDFDRMLRIHLVVMALMVVLMAFYIVHLFRTDRVPIDKKALWAVTLFLANLLAMPVYWYFYMWPSRTDGAV